MTGFFLIDCVFLFLVCYALVSMFYNLSQFLLRRYCKYPQRSFLLLELKHGSESFERDIRCSVSKSLSQKCALLIICTNLDTDEYTKLWRITDVYDHIILANHEEIISKLDTAANISISL